MHWSVQSHLTIYTRAWSVWSHLKIYTRAWSLKHELFLSTMCCMKLLTNFLSLLFLIPSEIIRRPEDYLKSLWNQKVYWCFDEILKGNTGLKCFVLDITWTHGRFANMKYHMQVNFFLGNPVTSCRKLALIQKFLVKIPKPFINMEMLRRKWFRYKCYS